MQGEEIVAGADDDRLRFEGSPARLQPRRRGDARDRLAPERYAETLSEISRQARDRLAQLHPYLVGAEQRARERLRAQALSIGLDLAGLHEFAFRAHFGGEELLQHAARLGPPRDRQQSALQHRNSCRGCNFDPDIA